MPILSEEKNFQNDVFFCKGIVQTRGWKHGDWWCRCKAHVWKGRKERGMRYQEAPPDHAIEDMYRRMFNEHNLRVWDVHNGFVEVWDKGEDTWVMRPGSEMVGSGKYSRDVSLWTGANEFRHRTTKIDGVTLLHGIDQHGRVLVSNNTGILGGLTDQNRMRDILHEINKEAQLLGFVPNLIEWRDQNQNRRLSWGHPCYLLFQNELEMEQVMKSMRQRNQRPDGGGTRILKIEWSVGEVVMPADENQESIGRFSVNVGSRFDPRMSDIRDSLAADMMYLFDGYEFDVMGTPACEWPCNVNRSVRKFAGGLVGDAADEAEVDSCERPAGNPE